MKMDLFDYYVLVFNHLMKLDYNYDALDALKTIVYSTKEIDRSFYESEEPRNCAIEIGYSCG